MIVAYLFMCLIYGTTFLAIRVGNEAGMPPFLFAALRFAAAGLLTLIFMFIYNKRLFPKHWNDYLRLATLGLLSTTSVFAIVYYMEQFVPSSYTALMASTIPLLVFALGHFNLKQKVTRMEIVGLIISLLGVIAVAWPGINKGIPHWLVYTAILLLSQLAAAIGVIKSRHLLNLGMSPFVLNGFQSLFGSIGLFVFSIVHEQYFFGSIHSWGMGISALLYLTLFGSMIATSLYYWLVKKISALVASTWTYVSPVVAIVAGYLWFQEPVYLPTIIGTAMILLGVFTLNYKSFKEAYWRQQAHSNTDIIKNKFVGKG